MKSLKFAIIVCLFFTTDAATAQTNADMVNGKPRDDQSSVFRADSDQIRRDAAKPTKTDDCVGPVSFCNIYFGR